MLSHRLLRAQRIPLLRPLRPPNGRPSAAQSRLFARTALYMISSRPATRPQLPYLSQPNTFRQQPLINYQISRLLSTETRERVIAQAWLTAKYLVITFTFLFLAWVARMGIQIQQTELRNPTPDEWRFWTQQYMRTAREEMNSVKDRRKVVIDWVRAGLLFKEVLKRLEDPAYDGAGLVPAGAEEEDGAQAENILIPGIGKAGYDISAKSYEWRTCYFEVLMGSALAAEHLEDTMLDTTRKLVFDKDMVVGPSNPDPRPPPAMYTAPLEENCVPTYEKPEVFYMRILTGKGFSTRQKLDAAEAYANWLDAQGLPGSAEEMHRWALDIAKDALPLPANVIVDESTDILKEDAGKEATANLLRATTGLAVHYARSGNVPAALPILLSVLRARSNAPLSTDPLSLQDESQNSNKRGGPSFEQVVSAFINFFKAPKFPPPPPTGDEPFTRRSDLPSCVESELMLYIGEILFASAPEHRQEGINWTRQAVRIAEANLVPSSSGGAKGERETDQCKQCLLTGVQNWEVMLQQFAAAQRATAAREGGRNAGWLEWRGWFGRDGGVKGRVLDEAAAGVVEEELKAVQKLKQRLAREAIQKEEEEEAARGSFVWIR